MPYTALICDITKMLVFSIKMKSGLTNVIKFSPFAESGRTRCLEKAGGEETSPVLRKPRTVMVGSTLTRITSKSWCLQ